MVISTTSATACRLKRSRRWRSIRRTRTYCSRLSSGAMSGRARTVAHTGATVTAYPASGRPSPSATSPSIHRTPTSCTPPSQETSTGCSPQRSREASVRCRSRPALFYGESADPAAHGSVGQIGALSDAQGQALNSYSAAVNPARPSEIFLVPEQGALPRHDRRRETEGRARRQPCRPFARPPALRRREDRLRPPPCGARLPDGDEPRWVLAEASSARRTAARPGIAWRKVSTPKSPPSTTSSCTRPTIACCIWRSSAASFTKERPSARSPAPSIGRPIAASTGR